MASDLIPPPAPSWRFQPDGTPRLVELPPEPKELAEPAPPPPPEDLPPSRFRNRFGFLFGALGGVVLAAAAIFAIVLATNDGPADEGLYKTWSQWQPEETTLTAGPADIATHVETKYRGDDGKQIVSVTGGPLSYQGIKLNVAIRPGSGNVQLPSGHAIMYTLNGLGPDGSILGGTPSTKRHQLLRREALELSLYSFRYLPDVDMVVTLLPPPPPTAASEAAAASAASSSSSSSSTAATPAKPAIQAVFYRPGDLKGQLQVPLGTTVPAKAPTPDTIPAAESKTIDSLTLSNLFNASFQQAQDGQPYLVLDRPTG
jgi:hypothetical protein